MRRSLALLAVLTFAPLAAASSGAAAPRRIARETDRVLYDERPGESTWARGSDWKASFGPHGTAFTPFLGSEAPRNFPVRFGAPEVRIGASAIDLHAHASPERDGDTIRFDRGAVHEMYVATVRSVEQQFVVESALGAGDIVVLVPVETELEPRVDGDALRFENELGGVSYGGAIAIDANGRRLALERTFDGERIEIRVPAAFADSAAYPLTIDPVINAFGVFTGTPQEESSPDVTYDANTGRYFAVTEIAFSATDHDVLSSQMENDGTPIVGGQLAVDATSDYWATPRCANGGYTSDYAVVAAVGIPAAGGRQIKARVFRLGAFGAPVVLSDADDGDPSLPDVAGCDQLTEVRFGVTWQTRHFNGDFDILARFLRFNNVLTSGIMHLSADPVFRDEVPSISSGSTSAEFSIVWQREVTATNHDIYHARIMNDGTVSLAPAALSTAVDDDRNPSISDVAVTGINSMVAFEREAGGNRNIVVGEVNFAGVLENVIDISALDPSTEGREQFSPAIEADLNRFLVAWCERDVSTTEIRATEFHGSNFDTVIGAVQRELVTPGAIDARSPRLAGRTLEIGSNPGFFAVWADDAGLGRDIFGARYEPEIGVPPRAICFGDGSSVACPCGNVGQPGRGCPNSQNAAGALLGSTGNAAMLADTFVLNGSGMPANSSCLYFQGTGASTPPTLFGDGLRCTSGSTVRLGTKLNSPSGTSAYPAAGDTPVSVRGLLPWVGGVRYYQTWYRNAAAFCTPATFNLSNALQVYWVPL